MCHKMQPSLEQATKRRTATTWSLIRQALGPRSGWSGKVLRFGEILGNYTKGERMERLQRLRSIGVIDQIPSSVQLVVGSIDMLRFWISPAAADYYKKQGISYGFHQLLRFVDEPASLADPVGFFSTRDGIIGHLMQVVHANPVYDLQLLQIFPDGLDQLEAQLLQMGRGTHPRALAIDAIVEEADYHQRLLGYVRAYKIDPRTPPPLRKNIEGAFSEVERTFGSLTEAMRYFCHLPHEPLDGMLHLLRVKAFPVNWRTTR